MTSLHSRSGSSYSTILLPPLPQALTPTPFTTSTPHPTPPTTSTHPHPSHHKHSSPHPSHKHSLLPPLPPEALTPTLPTTSTPHSHPPTTSTHSHPSHHKHSSLPPFIPLTSCLSIARIMSRAFSALSLLPVITMYSLSLFSVGRSTRHPVSLRICNRQTDNNSDS